MAKRNSIPIRSDPSLKDIINKVKAKNLIRGKEIRTPRITLAMARQYKKYPNLLKELEDSELL